MSIECRIPRHTHYTQHKKRSIKQIHFFDKCFNNGIFGFVLMLKCGKYVWFWWFADAVVTTIRLNLFVPIILFRSSSSVFTESIECKTLSFQVWLANFGQFFFYLSFCFLSKHVIIWFSWFVCIHVFWFRLWFHFGNIFIGRLRTKNCWNTLNTMTLQGI